MSAQRKPTDPSQHAEDCTESQVAEALCAAAAEVAPASADLPIDGQAVQGGGWGYPQSTVVLNHNETLSAEDGDNDAQPEAVADLAPAQTEQDALKGGPVGGFSLNHNETLAAEDAGSSETDAHPRSEVATDLAPAQAEQDILKGGPSSGIKLNHNETLAADASGESSADC